MNYTKMHSLESSLKLFKALADESRLLIINILSKKSSYVEELSKMLNLSPPTVSFHLKKLEEAGLISSKKEQYYMNYSLNKAILTSPIQNYINFQTNKISLQEKRAEQYEQKIIKNFFKYGKLKTIPVQRKKRRIVLQHIIKSFSKDKKYHEKEVNIILADFHDDFCFLRREMISEKLMERKNGLYWLK